MKRDGKYFDKEKYTICSWNIQWHDILPIPFTSAYKNHKKVVGKHFVIAILQVSTILNRTIVIMHRVIQT